MQQSKVAALGVAPLFQTVWIDAQDGPERRLGKVGLFRQIQAEYGWPADRVLAVGDSEAGEIAAGNARQEAYAS